MNEKELIEQNAEYKRQFENAFLSVYGFTFSYYKRLILTIARSGMYNINKAAFTQSVREYENRIRTIKQILL